MPEINDEFTYEGVADLYEHDQTGLHWVITLATAIKALRLREDYNPLIFQDRSEVWVGEDSPTREWGNTLANDTVQVPLFVKRTGAGSYTYIGVYEVLADQATPAQLAFARDSVPHDRGVSRIVFLRQQ